MGHTQLSLRLGLFNSQIPVLGTEPSYCLVQESVFPGDSPVALFLGVLPFILCVAKYTWLFGFPLTSTAFPLAPYLLRELMNFSLARLLTSFKVPSSGLLHLLTPVAGVCCSLERKHGSSLWMVRFHPSQGPIEKATRNHLFHSWEWSGVINPNVSSCTASVLTWHAIVFSIVDGKTVLFPGKAPFHHKLHL